MSRETSPINTAEATTQTTDNPAVVSIPVTTPSPVRFSPDDAFKSAFRIIGATAAFAAWITICAANQSVAPSIVGNAIDMSKMSPSQKTAAQASAGIIMGAFALGTGSNWSSFLGTLIIDVNKLMFKCRNEMTFQQKAEAITRVTTGLIAGGLWITFCALNGLASADLYGAKVKIDPSTSAKTAEAIFLGALMLTQVIGLGSNIGSNLVALPFEAMKLLSFMKEKFCAPADTQANATQNEPISEHALVQIGFAAHGTPPHKEKEKNTLQESTSHELTPRSE